MPATIEVLLPLNKKEIENSDLPLLIKNEQDVFLAAKKDERADNYILIYLHDVDGNREDKFGNVVAVSNLKGFSPWDGSLNIENN